MSRIVPKNAVLIPESAECVFSGVLFDAYQWDQELFDGTTARFEMLRRLDTVRIIPIIDGKLLVQDEHQPNLKHNMTFPGGRVERDETSVLGVAKRELQEETGYRLSNWKLVDVVQPETKIEFFVYTFIAWGDADFQGHNHDSGEKISSTLMEFEDVRKLVLEDVGYLGKAYRMILPAQNVQDLLEIPEYSPVSIP